MTASLRWTLRTVGIVLVGPAAVVFLEGIVVVRGHFPITIPELCGFALWMELGFCSMFLLLSRLSRGPIRSALCWGLTVGMMITMWNVLLSYYLLRKEAVSTRVFESASFGLMRGIELFLILFVILSLWRRLRRS